MDILLGSREELFVVIFLCKVWRSMDNCLGLVFSCPFLAGDFQISLFRKFKFPKMPPLSISTKESHAWDLRMPDTWAPSKLVHPELPQTSDLFWEPLNPLCPAVLCRHGGPSPGGNKKGLTKRSHFSEIILQEHRILLFSHS